MIFNTLQILKTALEDGSNGVVAQLASVPNSDSITLPSAIGVVTSVDNTVKGAQLARRWLPKGFATDDSVTPPVPSPQMILFPPTPADYDGFVSMGLERAAGTRIAMGYVTEDTESHSASRESYLVMRAAKRTVEWMLRTQTGITRNQISVVRTVDYQLNELMALLGESMVNLMGVWTFTTEDTWKQS